MTVGQPRVTKIAVADVVSNRRRGGDIRVLLSPKTVGSTSGFMGVLTLAPGEHVSEHYHPYSEEFLYVVRGQVAMRVEDEVVELGPGDAMVVPIGARHRLRNTGEEEALAVFHLGPLAPSPELGHVDTEKPPNAAAASPEVGGGRT
jgi:putative monooxygenase